MKRYGIVTALCLALIGITACGDAAGEAETGEKQTESEAEVKEVELWDSEKELEGELVIRSLIWTDASQFYVDQFMEKYPGVTIEVIAPDFSSFYAFSSESDISEVYRREEEEVNKMVTELLGDSPADLYDISSMPTFTKGMEVYFEDLNPYTKQDPNFNLEDYYTNILKACEYNGSLYAMPESFSYNFVRINKNYLSSDFSQNKSINYQELAEIWKAADERGLINENVVLTESAWFVLEIFNMETEIRMNIESKEVFYNTEEFIEFLKSIKEMRTEYHQYMDTVLDEDSIDDNILLSLFKKMDFNYSSYLPKERNNTTQALVLDASDGSGLFENTGRMYGIYSGSQQKALAWEFIKFCIEEKEYSFSYGDENYYENYDCTMSTPINKNNAKKIYEYYLRNNEETVDWLINCDESRNRAYWEDQTLSNVFCVFLQDYYEGNITAEECAQLMQERAAIYMKE